MSCSSCKGVRPAACTSPTRGSEILPSDRTGIDRVRSGSFQTLIDKTSSLPITKLSSCACVVLASFCVGSEAVEVAAGGAGVPDVACAQSAFVVSRNIAQTNSAVRHKMPESAAISISLYSAPMLMVPRLNLLFRSLSIQQEPPIWFPKKTKYRIPEHSSGTGQSCTG